LGDRNHPESHQTAPMPPQCAGACPAAADPYRERHLPRCADTGRTHPRICASADRAFRKGEPGRPPPHRPPPEQGACEIRADAQADMPSAEASGAICVQRFDDSRNSAIHTTYRISLRSSSLREPRYPLLRVVSCYDAGDLGRPPAIMASVSAGVWCG
jgi:hypothetical protein